MNKVIMIGRLTAEPEVRFASNNTAVGKYTLAVDRRIKKEGQPSADFHTCVVFGKSAEFAEKYFHKGTKVVVSGSLQNNNYKDKNGNKVYGYQIVVDEQEFAESKNTDASVTHQDAHTDDFIQVPDTLSDELPFN